MHAIRQRGFTLTELLTTIAVTAIGLSLVIPSFDTVVSNNRRASAVNQLVSTLHLARSEAITRNQQIAICPSADGASCAGDWDDGWLLYADANRDEVLDEDEEVLGTSAAAARLTITTADFPVIAYTPAGRIADAEGEFTFCDHRGPTHARVVIVNAMGEPRLSETTLAGTAPACPA
jgi:type IV fimbrial biogenesis protein FimT